MAALIEGQQYGLSAQDKINSNKSIVFVKLTDSALRSIEEYVKNKNGTGDKPTIQFQNSNGILSLGSNLTYGFTLSNVEADGPQGSFECLRQNGHRSLESIGCMHMKMHIHANEDSYENTRVKMAAVEKEKKGSCTKVIKPAGAHLGRKIKMKGPPVNPVKPHASPPSASMFNKNPLKPMNSISNGSSNNQPKKLPEINKYQNQKPTPPPPPKSKFQSSPELLRQPIRDRIIHILAVRPYKRPELIVRLMSEGIRDKDKKGITAILSQVGTLKGNIYNIANYCWNEVQDNWKFCSPEELEIIRRRKQQALSANNTANESPPAPPNPSTSPLQKRLASDTFTVGQEPRGKKQRISHYNRPENPNYSAKMDSSDSSEKQANNKKIAYSPSCNIADLEIGSSPKSPGNSCDGFPKKSRMKHYSRPDQPNSKKETVDSSEKLHFTTTNKMSSFSPATNGLSHPSVTSEPSPKSPENSCDGFSNMSQRNFVHNNNNSPPDDSLSSSSLNLRNASREDSEKSIRKHTNGLGSSSNNKHPDKPFHKSQQPQLPTRSHEADKSNQKHSKSSVVNNNNSDMGKSSSSHSKTLSHARLTNSLLCERSPVSPDSKPPYVTKESKSDPCSRNSYVNNNNSIKMNGYNQHSSYNNNKRPKVTPTTNGSCSTSPHSPESDSNDSIGANSPVRDPLNLPPGTPESDTEIPDYVLQYVRIISPDQRNRYKADFNAHYQEYLFLHSKVEKIRKNFKSLEDHLRHYEEGSEQFNEISSIITEQYRAYHDDENVKKAQEKYFYLHSKLSHIKKLVVDYDKDCYPKS